MAKQADGTCSRCHDLDIDRLFTFLTSPSEFPGKPVAVIDNLSRNCRRARCQLCRFLSKLTLLDNAKIGDAWALYIQNFDHLLTGDVHPENAQTAIDDRTVLTLLPLDEEEVFADNVEKGGCDLILRTKDGAVTNGGLSGRVLHKSRVDYKLLKTWINDCCKNHKSCSAVSHSPFKGTRVIDCATGNVIDYQGGGYAALSYCIGPPAKQRRRPKVVTDAILCCKGLGIPYLWVDAICIDQTDKTALALAISNMHLVYSSALVTIVSLGPSQTHGLPGVSTVSRREQPVLQTATCTYSSTMHNLPVAIANSKWSTRAWCFQEAVLSQRILFFGDHQVYFLCSRSVRAESTTADPHCSTLAMDGLRMMTISKRSISNPKEDVWDFGAWVAEYSTRDLSYQTDALNAFRGVLGTSKYLSLWGIPLVFSKRMTSPTAAFTIGLSWSTSYNKHAELRHLSKSLNAESSSFMKRWPLPTDDTYIRPQFPSWAWTACKVFRWPIMYKGPGDFPVDSEGDFTYYAIDPILDVRIEDPHKSPIAFPDLCKVIEPGARILSEPSRYLQVVARTFSLKLCRIIIAPAASNFQDEIDLLSKAIAEARQQSTGRQNQPEQDHLRQAQQYLTKIESLSNELKKESLARYCLRIEHPDYPSFSPETLHVEQSTEDEMLSELEDGRYLIDFDRPPTIEDGYCDLVQKKELMGVVLFHRTIERLSHGTEEDQSSDFSEGECCVLVVERHSSNDFYTRVGLLWIDQDHLELLILKERIFRLG